CLPERNSTIENSTVPENGDTKAHIATLESRLEEQAQQIAELWQVVEAKSQKRTLPRPEDALPDGFTWLSDFAGLHHIPYREAERLYKVAAIHGQKITVSKGRTPIAI